MVKNMEAIRLYRDILRTSRLFSWNDIKTGEKWSDILKRNARKEFEQARYENDPLLIARMLVVGRDALIQSTEKLAAASQVLKDNIDKTRKT